MLRLLLEYRLILVATLVFIVSTLRYASAQEDADCGVRKFSSNYDKPTRFVNSDWENPQLAKREDYPWMVSVFRKQFKFSSYTYQCGGTLIPSGVDGEILILTSAKCVTEFYNSTNVEPYLENIRVVIAPVSSNYNKNSEKFGSQKFGVQRIEINPLYEVKTHDADAALIQIAGKARLGKYVFPACLPPKNTPRMGVKQGMVGEIAGFGWDSRRNVTESLRYARYPLTSSVNCQEQRGVKVNDFLEFCAGYQKDATACQGDFGGGLVFQHPKNDGRYYVQGILSNLDTNPVTEDGTCENFNIFQRVGPFLEWIKETQEKFSKEEASGTLPKQRPTSGVPLNYVPEYAKIARDFHNHFRAVHQAPPVRLVSKIQVEAQKLAEELVGEDSLEAPEDSQYSANLYAVPRYVTAQDGVRDAVQYWYRGSNTYDKEYPVPSAFTQMVWKGSSQIGVGVATNGKKTVVVCFYYPKGNVYYEGVKGYQRTKSFSENVSIIPKGY